MLCELYTFRLLGFSFISQFYAPKFLANASHKSILLHGKQAKKVGEFSLFSNSGRNTAKKGRIHVRQQSKMQLK